MSMKKRIFSILLALVMVLGLLLTAALADVPPTSGTCGENLTWTLEDGVLTISGSGAMEFWSSPPWYNSHNSITKVQIEAGVTSIGEGAFNDCSSLTGVSIPNSVTSVNADLKL